MITINVPYHRRQWLKSNTTRGATLNLRDHNAQISETYAMIETLNKLTKLGMPNTKVST